MFRLSVLLLLSLLAFQVALSSNSFDIRHHMTTKSSYWSDPAIASETPFVANSSDTFPTGCQAIFINLLSRHGTRYPTSSDITKLQNLEKKLHTYGQYFKPQYAWLANWTCPYSQFTFPFLFLSLFQPLTFPLFLLPLSQKNRSKLDNSSRQENSSCTISPRDFRLASACSRLPINPTSTSTKPLLVRSKFFFQSCSHSSLMGFLYNIVPRAAMSGQSFGYALNENTGQLGASKFQPFFTYSESHDEDYTLRFFDNCPNYDTQVAVTLFPLPR